MTHPAMNRCLLVLLLAGCGPDPTMRMQTGSMRPVQSEDSRIEVTRIGVFADDIAYGSRRGVYAIVDRKTGKEYIGISGVGITETSAHSAGKAGTQKDER